MKTVVANSLAKFFNCATHLQKARLMSACMTLRSGLRAAKLESPAQRRIRVASDEGASSSDDEVRTPKRCRTTRRMSPLSDEASSSSSSDDEPSTPILLCRERCTSESEPCTICLDPLTSSVARCPCGHSFHSACIKQWLWCAPEGRCPNCAAKVSKRQLEIHVY